MRQPLRPSLAALSALAAAAALLVCLLWILPSAASAQPPMSPPAPELQKLAYLVGSWEGESETKSGPTGGPGGKVHTTDSCEWFPGGYYLVCRTKYSGAMGTIESLSEIGYDAAGKAYTYHSINNFGTADTATGTVTGDTWTWSFATQMGPHKVPARYVSTTTSPTSYTFKVESKGEGGAWTTFLEGSRHKLGSK
ncbi:MAG TPA: DUF1579 family protein [Thermoanaerobaculia bacterium]|nr:DUF1579 family protein [Thermoanaerobaculia bacterium]